jgi:hypothetical protein
MPLNTQDVLKLQTWTFIKDYENRRVELLVLARAAYEATEYLHGTKPTPDGCETVYAMMLMGSDVFKGMVARKRHLPPSFYESMCLALTRYVLHINWGEILVI